MLEKPLPPAKAAARLAQARLAEVSFASGRVLGSMYTTPHPAGLAAFHAFAEANLGNSGLYPGTAALERELLVWLGELVGLPPLGLVTSGGSEANLLALWAARQASPDRKVVLIGANAHFSLLKALNLLGLEGRELPLGADYCLDVAALEAAADKQTLAIVGQAGSTELGLCDDLPALARVAREVGAHLHVDAAFGGFSLPFLSGPPHWQTLGGEADTLAVDPHKLGRAPLPAGALLVRDPALLIGVAQAAPYLTRETQVGVLGTRCSAGVAGAWATVAAMGRAGYRRQALDCMKATGYLVATLRELGLEPAVEPQTNLAAFPVKRLRELLTRLAERGWYPSRVEALGALRVVVMPHVTPPVIDRFATVLAELLG